MSYHTCLGKYSQVIKVLLRVFLLEKWENYLVLIGGEKIKPNFQKGKGGIQKKF